MFKKLTGSILALSIVFTGLTAAPARADHELARFLLGVGAIAIIANEVNKNNKAKAANTNTHKPNPPKASYNNYRDKRCLEQRWTSNGWKTYRNQKCMQKYQKKVVQKPRECLRKKWTNNGWEKFYSRRCLRAHGFNS